MIRTRLIVAVAAAGVLGGCQKPGDAAAPPPAPFAEQVAARVPPALASRAPGPIAMQDFVTLLATADEIVAAQGLEQVIAAQELRGAQALYEPEAYLNLSYDPQYLPTTAEEALRRGTASSTGNASPYRSRDTLLRTGLTMRAPTGADIDLFFETTRIVNSLQQQAAQFSPEYRGSLGVALTQPLLRNAGRSVTEAGVRTAETDERVAGETARLVLAQRAFEGVRNYLLIQRAEARVGNRRRAVGLAEALAAEMRGQVAVGLRSDTDLAEAQAEVGLRRAALSEAEQALEEQIGAFQTFFSARADGAAGRWRPDGGLREPSEALLAALDLDDADAAYARRPEGRVNDLLIERETIAEAVAENQLLPELNLRLEVSSETLNADPAGPRRYFAQDPGFYSARAGVEFRTGIGGDTQRKAALEAARLRLKQAQLTRDASRQRIGSEVAGMRSILGRARAQVAAQGNSVAAQRRLVAVEQARMESGQSSRVEVLARQLDLIETEEAQADAVAQLNLSGYLAAQVDGALLSWFGLE